MSKRRFFQMHLSTAVVLMLVAGVLVWANVRERTELRLPYNDGSMHVNGHGWPAIVLREWIEFVNLRERPDFPNPSGTLKRDEAWFLVNAAVNTLIALAILLAVWQVCEWRIRRASTQQR